MKPRFIAALPFMFTAIFWLSLRPFPVNEAQINAEFEALVQTLPTSGSINLTFNMTVNDNGKKISLQEAPTNPFIAIRRRSLQNGLTQLAAVDDTHLTACNAIHRIVLTHSLQSQRIKLVKSLDEFREWTANSTPEERREQRYSESIQTYLTIDMTAQDLITYGEEELRIAHDLLYDLEQRIIVSGAATSLADFETNNTQTLTTESEINAAFNRRRPIIAANMGKFFKPYSVPETRVRASRKTRSFYALGTYQNSTFTYYWDGKTFLAKDLDYLMMHELVPGHHLQMNVTQQAPLCPKIRKGLPPFKAAFSEGWSTYIETLGGKLGLLQTHEQQLGQRDWNLIRSIRVILDVRIHHDGWSKDQVIEFWDANMPERLHPLAHREYNRMLKMPMQALTYKTGSKAILELRAKEETRLGKKFDIREFHDTLLRLGPVPLHALDEIYAHARQVDKTP